MKREFTPAGASCSSDALVNPTTFAVQRGPEVYVYVLGRLVMKRHLDAGVSVTFHVAPRGVRW